MTAARRSLCYAAFCFILFFVVGVSVSDTPPDALDRYGRALTGQAPRLALVFTDSCLWYSLISLGAGAIVLAVVRPHWRARTIFSIVTTIIAWQTSDVLKLVFKRPRPDYWVLVHETSYSYSSGHALFAIVVYGLWSYFIAKSSLPRSVRVPLSTVLALWACGVIWSRLALGAHYITDLIGGVLLGGGILSIAAVVAFAWPVAARDDGGV